MKLLRDAIRHGRYILDLDARDIETICRETVDHLRASGAVPDEAAEEVTSALLAREAQTSTAIGHAVAIPHAYLEDCKESIIAFVRLARSVNLGAPDGIPTRLVFFLLGPPQAAALHLDSLANIARLAADDEFRFDVTLARSPDDLIVALDRFAERTAPAVPIVEAPTDGLEYSGRLGGGLAADLRRRIACYASDFRDGLHVKTAGSTIFLFFACLAPAVTFGGIMSASTGGQIGAVEMLLGTAVSGLVFALFAGQPLIILGGTGPLLIFTAILYQLCGDLSVDFLPAYGWVGLWSALLLILLAIADASCLMRYFTRFTDEIFAALISLIFIYEAVRALVEIFHDLEVRKHHATALLSLLLALGTFYIATSLSRMRRSRYLLPAVREFLSDFGPTIALAAMTGVAIWLHEVQIDVLPAPEAFGTTSGRSWSIDLFSVPVWVRFAAAAPALFVTVLMYLDQNITSRLVNSRDHRLRKGPAYHLDLAVVGVLMGLCSLFGLPWLVAATVRSLNHVRSLATIEDLTTASGDKRERILHVRETRITGIVIHLLIGLSLFLLPVLRQIPMAILYGLFLFMGVVSMAGNQFFERMRLWVMDANLYPSTHYLRRVPTWTIHKFTFVQLLCLLALWVVKASAWAIMFPLFIALMVPVRLGLGRVFAPAHLDALDAGEVPEEEGAHWTG